MGLVAVNLKLTAEQYDTLMRAMEIAAESLKLAMKADPEPAERRRYREELAQLQLLQEAF